MNMGLGYDWAEGRALCGALSAIMTGVSYATSAEMAAEVGPFPGYAAQRAGHAAGDPQPSPRGLGQAEELRGAGGAARAAGRRQLPASRSWSPRATAAWDRALALGERHGYRNAQASVIAPTGTIGLVMDCDTTGIEPDFSLVKFKKLAGGGYFKIINQSVPAALESWATTRRRMERIIRYAVGQGTLAGAPGVNRRRWRRRASRGAIEAVEGELETAFDIAFVFNQFTLGKEFCRDALGVPEAKLKDSGASACCKHLGFSHDRDRGGQELRLRDHDAGGRAGAAGRASAGVRLRQPLREDRQAVSLGREPYPHDGGCAEFISGAISKTMNMPSDAGIEDARRPMS